MTAGSPTFAEAWPLIQARVAGKPVIAHNASFDCSVLRHSLDAEGLECTPSSVLLHPGVRPSAVA